VGLDQPKERGETALLRAKVEALQNQLRQLDAQKEELAAQNIKLRTGMKDVLDRYDKSEADNSNLRAHIVSISKPPGQVNDDGFYIQKLNWLNEFTQQWVAGAFKGQRGQALEPHKELELQKLLDRYNAGRALLQLMQRSHATLQTIYRIPDRRIALVRQLIALFLSVYIFRPFCVGVPEDVSDILHETVAHVFENGT
jgi:chromosome segregation ATPase